VSRNPFQGYVAGRQSLDAFSQPTELPPLTHRDIAKDPTREVVYGDFDRAMPLADDVGTFSFPLPVVTLSRPHANVDVYVAVQQPLTVNNGDTALEIAGVVYGIAGNARAPIARGAYMIDVDQSLIVQRNIWLIAARTGAERFDVEIRVAGHNQPAGTRIIGSTVAIGYDGQGSNESRLASRAFQSGRIPSLFSFRVKRAAELRSFIATNVSGVATNLQFFDRVAGVGAGTSAMLSYLIPNGATLEIDFFDKPVEFYEGITWQSSSTPGVFTAAGAGALTVQLEYA
jgi:hypothetical protein